MRVGEVRYFFRIEVGREGREVPEGWEPIPGRYMVIQNKFLAMWCKWVGKGSPFEQKETSYRIRPGSGET